MWKYIEYRDYSITTNVANFWRCNSLIRGSGKRSVQQNKCERKSECQPRETVRLEFFFSCHKNEVRVEVEEEYGDGLRSEGRVCEGV